MTSSANKLKQAKALRQLQIDHIEELLILANSAVTDHSLHVRFKLRCACLDNIYDEFRKQHDIIVLQLATAENPDCETEKTIRSSFLDNYYTVKTIFSNIFDDVVETTAQIPNVKLPKISLPTFDGDYKNWPTYFDLFSNLIHNNKSLSDIEKFQYLLSSLTSRALSVLKHIPVTSDNYISAFNSLVERFQNKRLLANSCWREISNASRLSNESVSGLRQLLECFVENLKALQNLGLPVNQWDFILFHMLSHKLDDSTLTRFELQEASTDIPSFSKLKDFLLKQCTALESIATSASTNHPKSRSTAKITSQPKYNSKNSSSNQHYSSVLVNSSSPPKEDFCNYCKSSHTIYKCSSFQRQTPSARLTIARNNNWCTNCLHSAHKQDSCESRSTCRICQRRHHTLLHIPKSNIQGSAHNNERTPASSDMPSNSVTTVAQVHSLSSFLSSKTGVLLSTARVEILDAWGHYRTIRILLDGGSQVNVISQKCVQRLGLRTSTISMSIFGLGQTNSRSSCSVVCKIRPLEQTAYSLSVDAVVLPKVCNSMPSSAISTENWNHLANIKLADPLFNVSSDIDMLLGADVFSKIILDGKIPGDDDQPTAMNTVFGWILMGRFKCSSNDSSINSFLTFSDFSLDNTLRKFWEIEEIPKPDLSLSPDNILCEKSFVETHSRDSSGRFSVSLPFKGPAPIFGDSRNSALRRFYSLERRLLRNTSLYISYCSFMRDYLECGHMELVSSPPLHSSQVFYIPHHSVTNVHSSTSPIRVVFDASAKTEDNVSLNDCLLIGSKLQKDIFNLLLQFRLHTIVLTADIKQMYRQINIHHAHRDYQRILWRFSADSPVEEYRLNTVTYGVASAPFLALRTLQQLALVEGDSFPLAANVIKSDMYVDDIVTGCSSLDEAIILKDQLISLLQKGGFTLRKWSSNNISFLNTIPEELQQSSFLIFSDQENVVKILGLKWQPTPDGFCYSLECSNRPCTKRTILSEVARVFDPLGFLAPITFFTKHLIQYLWTLGLGWDDIPPPEVLARWKQYKSDLPCLLKLHIPRGCLPQYLMNCQLHGFCDSSEKGYACVVYLRCKSVDGNITVHLLCAKSKVSPLKRISLPRLELCAALLLSQLISCVLENFKGKLSLDSISAYSDSSVALTWIKSSPHRFKTFVSNRITQIQELVPPNQWFHVSSGDNPADCASRGLLPSQLLTHSLWWAGPPWLKLSQDHWPVKLFDISDMPAVLEEEKKTTLSSFVLLDVLDSLLDRYSSLSKIKRIVAYCLRFVNNSRYLNSRKTGAFTAHELQSSLMVLVKIVQSVCFSDVIKNLQCGKSIPKCFRKLSTFIDSDGVLRVGGRLTHSQLLYDQKHPALLPRKHRLTELLIEDTHKEHLHPGLQTLSFLLMQNFWILSARRAIRSVLSKCLKCFKVRPIPYQPPMGDLPSVRVSQVKPFQCVGVDFGGPFCITLGKARGIKSQKAYLCLFVCTSTKAIHLELASDLTSECFIAALRRLIARRGRCSCIFSDRGTNFIGANKELIKLLQHATEYENIVWSFNPPSAPHFGGLWESGVKSVKTHLKRVVGEQIMTYEEFYTVLVQIEALLNSRPLCPLSSDPNDFSVLTPGHFLTLEPLTCLPESDLSHISVNCLSRWQLIQRLHRDFWKRWHLEYLNTLQQKHKWLQDNFTKIDPGMLVLIKDDKAPPSKWRLGRITQIHPGADGICRVATVRTNQGLLQRPMVKLCPLPVHEIQ